MKKRQSAWRIWAHALGPKAGRNEKEADIIAFVRTVILISYMTTNFFIVAGVVRQVEGIMHSCRESNHPHHEIVVTELIPH
jgi:hypothetical protein